MRLDSDIDIDLADRNSLLKHIQHVSASMRKVDPIRKHSTGVYITDVPYDPINDMCSIDYSDMETRGYFKLDLLNVHVYNMVRDENHLVELMREPNWNRLKDRQFVEQLIHLGNHYNSLCRMPEPINTIPRLAMFLAVIRPSKKHLIGRPWKEIATTVWDRDSAEGYSFRKSHAIAYAQLVVVHMNLLEENGN